MIDVSEFLKAADEITAKYWEASGFIHAPTPTHTAEFAEKWCKVYAMENGNRRIYAFIAMMDGYTKTLGTVKAGDIHKPATYKVPAKHARGNIFEPHFRNCLTPYGPIYLK